MVSVVAFVPHPDDEVLMTGGLLARLADAGHRVGIVSATDGSMDALDGEPPRLRELRASGAVLGASAVHCLGFADSGRGPLLFPDPADRPRFVSASIADAADRLARIVDDSEASVLIGVEPEGITGHPDHVRASAVARAVARSRPTLTLWEATGPRLGPRRRDAARRIVRVDVRPQVEEKRTALACHETIVGGAGRSARLVRALLRLPAPLARVVLGTEWVTVSTASTVPELPPRGAGTRNTHP